MTTPNVPFGTSNALGVNFYDIFTPPAATSGYNIGLNAPFRLGQTMDGTDGSKWVYVVLSTGGTTGQGYVVTFNSAFTAVMMSNSVGAFGDKIGVPCCSAALSGDYIWVQVYGIAPNVRFNAASVINTALASTTTAGAIDDAVGNPTKNLPGIVATATVTGGGLFPCELNWPVVGTTN